MSLFHSEKPVICKVPRLLRGGRQPDMALCSDLLVIADDARIGYPPSRVWGVPTTALWAHRIGDQRAKRLLFTGDLISGAQALEWGLAIDAPPPGELDERFEALVERISHVPANQLVMMKLLVNQALCTRRALHATQVLGTPLRRHRAPTRPRATPSRPRAAEAGFKQAVADRDAPFDS